MEGQTGEMADQGTRLSLIPKRGTRSLLATEHNPQPLFENKHHSSFPGRGRHYRNKGIFETNDRFENSGYFENTGRYNNSGRFKNSGLFENSGNLNISGRFKNDGGFENSGNLNTSGRFKNTGHFENTVAGGSGDDSDNSYESDASTTAEQQFSFVNRRGDCTGHQQHDNDAPAVVHPWGFHLRHYSDREEVAEVDNRDREIEVEMEVEVEEGMAFRDHRPNVLKRKHSEEGIGG